MSKHATCSLALCAAATSTATRRADVRLCVEGHVVSCEAFVVPNRGGLVDTSPAAPTT
ncbi:MAG TPA: hypothetical protein VD838_04670 [Anaeromyxobacteraceae bacterium]|nr:hypothetical protein [Anaeromyxobacteraceae bacterium]